MGKQFCDTCGDLYPESRLYVHTPSFTWECCSGCAAAAQRNFSRTGMEFKILDPEEVDTAHANPFHAWSK